MSLKLGDVIKGIEPVSQEWRERARQYLNKLAIPQGSLGELMTVAEQLAAIKQSLKPSVSEKVVVTDAGVTPDAPRG